MHQGKVVTVALLSTLLCSAGLLLAMTARSQAKPVLPQAKAKPAQTKPGTADKYAEAQDHLRKARQILRDYLATNPSGDHAYFATRQLKALGTIIPTNSGPLPIQLQGDINWRVISVDAQEGYTKLTFEFTNQNATQNQGFGGFDSSPLVIVANNHLYKMKSQGFKLPTGLAKGDYGNWTLQAGVTASVEVLFEPFDEDVTEGVVRYASGGNGYTFSRMNTATLPDAKN